MDKLSQLKRWLLKRRHFSTAWYAKGVQSKPKEEEALSQLPDEVTERLLTLINELPTPASEQATVLEAVSDAIARWRKYPQRSNNSVVVLAHPVSSVTRVLTDCLTDEGSDSLKTELEQQSLSVKLLDWVERPTEVEEIKETIKRKLGWKEKDFPEANDSHYETRAETRAHKEVKTDTQVRDSATESAGLCSEGTEGKALKTDQTLTVAVIPNLGWCFLRSADGLEGIDYLEEMLLNDHRQFWVIGSGTVGWEYLQSTLKLGAYCGETIKMPKLNSEQLQSWLEPIIQRFNICFSRRALHQRLQESKTLLHADLSLEHLSEIRAELSQEVSATVQSSLRSLKEEIKGNGDEPKDFEESPKRDYFNRLADISEGVSVVALQLFVKSLRYREPEPTELASNPNSANGDSCDVDEQEKGDLEKTKRQLIATLPKLPSLPELDQGDLYLLYSLMLHGDMTIRALAKSLGDAPQVVNNQVQVLRSKQVVEQKDGVVKINPVYYPSLRKELSRNNFIIEVP